MKKTNLPAKVLSSVLACALAFTMTPTSAFASEPSQGSSAVDTAEDATVASDDAAAEEQAASPAQDQQAEAPTIHTEEVPVTSAPDTEEPAQPQQEPAVSNAAKADLEIITSSVSLSESPSTAFVFNGMNFQLNADDPQTVAFTGVSDAVSGQVDIPGQIETKQGSFTVTKILTGGSESSQDADVDAKTAAAKAAMVAASASHPNVVSVTIPATVKDIDTSIFAAFPNLRTVAVDDSNETFRSLNDMLFNKELSSLLLVPEGMEGAAVIPDTLATVPACVFSR